MSESAVRPEVVPVPTEPVAVPSARSRRLAQQHVREARDRLTSTTGTRPAFDHELLRQYAQSRLSASVVIVLLVVAASAIFAFWTRPIPAALWACSILCIHALIV